MKWEPLLRKTGKVFFYMICGITGAFSASAVATWMMIRPARKARIDCIPRISYGRLEPFTIITSDGLNLHAWVQLSQVATGNDWVLLLHGYRSDREILQTRRRFFARRGYHTLLLHFRGHGSSQRSRISYGFNERKDVRAAFDFIKSLHPDQPVRIGIDGISMGAAAAAYAVAYELVTPDWVILESCYDNLRRALTNRLELHVMTWFVPLIVWPMEFVAKHLFQLRIQDLNPAEALKKISCPVLVLAGDSEKVLKKGDVESLYQCIPEPKRLVYFPGAGHEDLLVNNPRRYIRSVADFLRDFSSQRLPGPKSSNISIAREIAKQAEDCT